MVMQVKIKTACKESMGLYSTFLKSIFNKLNYNFSAVGLPTEFRRITLLKSPHVFKKHKEQFEMRTYKQVFTIKENVSTSALKFLLLNKPKLVHLKLKAQI